MVDFRNLAAVEIVFLGPRLVIAEFGIGVFGSLAFGVFVLLRSHSVEGIALGVISSALELITFRSCSMRSASRAAASHVVR